MGEANEEDITVGPGTQEEERILVSVRIRPLSEKEASRNEVVDWECISDTTIIFKNHSSPERSMYPTSFTFDKVFRCDCSTRQVYEEGAKSVVLSAVKGINSSVFAYGQTSSGKTFTMSGITEYTMEDVFDYIQKHKERDFQLKFSAMEIYNESVRDLLTTDNTPLRLLDDPERGTVVEKLTEETLRDRNHFKELLAVCEAQRQIGETFLNEVSSRSHQILRLTIESSAREYLGKSNSSILTAALNFVDLAGSERASQALSAGSRLKEGSHINRSLLTLGTVIRKLSKGTTGHIPYRDSKLTRILQSSLGGNARTAVICTMSPARSYVEQSRNTLLFASCAKEVTTSAQINVVVSDKALVKHLQRELARLESELRSATPSVRSDATNMLREKESKIQELEGRVRELTLQLDLALSKIHDLQLEVEDSSPTIWERQEESSYPKLHARQSSDSSSSESIMTEHHSFNAGSPSSGSPQSPDRHSRLSYEENYSISDVGENLPPTSPFERMFIESPSDASSANFIQTHPKVVGLDSHQATEAHCERLNLSEDNPYFVIEGNGEQSPYSYAIDPYQVSEEFGEQTPDTFEIHRQQEASNGNGAESPYFVEFDPYQVSDEIRTPDNRKSDQYEVLGIPEETHKQDNSDPLRTPEAIREQYDVHVEDYCKEVRCIESGNTNNIQTSSLSPLKEGDSLLLTEHENTWDTDAELKQETVASNVVPCSLENHMESSSREQNDIVPEPEGLNCLEIRNNQSNSMISKCPLEVEKVKCKIKDKCRDGDDESVDSLKDIQGKVSVTKCDTEDKASHKSAGDIELVIPMTDIEASNDINDAENSKCVIETREETDGQRKEQVPDHQLKDGLHKTSKPIKEMKDVGLNPQDDLNTSVPWLSDSKGLQLEIVNLWHICNVSLVHRTHFFLLFINGDPADTIYMEVERRRLSYIKDAFAKDCPIVLEGRKLTPSSSKRALRNERKMLGRRMKKIFSSQERKDIYVKWAINLDSKRRSSQLAHRLWMDTQDMDHITQSANMVAKLVRFSEPRVPKEFFGLNLITNMGPRKSFSWKQSPKLLKL